MRKDIMFTSKGLHCRGWLFVPEGLQGRKAPTIVMGHGFTGVKEMGLANFAERFAAAGFVTLVFDYRYFGESEGEPRSQLFPLEQVEDFRNAVTWVSDQPEVDPQRIGLWGTSYGGGIATYVATFDKRIKAVVA
jgi:dienelactone hydrolase